MTDAEFRAWLARDNEQRCVLVELDYVAEGDDSPVTPEVRTLYLSDREFFDDVTNFAYIDVVKAAPQYSRSLSGDRLGSYSSTIGTLELDNADGALDFLLDLACDGSPIRFYYGGQKWPVADFKLIFSAITSKVSAPAFDRISVALRDTGLLLNKSIGGNTIGGGGPNSDRARPINFGYIHNEAAILADPPLDKYVHTDDLTGAAVAQEVRDRGVSVSFTDLANGVFQLAAPPDGLITCDVLSEPVGAGNVMVSDAFDHLIGTLAGLSALSLYDGAGPTFTVHDDDDYKVGISIPEARNVIDLLSDICDSGNCFWAVKRTGEFTFGRLRLNDIGDLIADSPPAIEAVDIREDDFDNGSFRLDHAPTQYYKFQGFMSRNWNKQTDFATSLSSDDQAVYSRSGLYLMQPDSVGTSYENAPELYHKTLAVSPVIDTLLSEVFSAFDLDSLARWMTTRRAMLLPWIELPAFTVGIDFYQLELGDPVRMTIQDADGTIRYRCESTLFQVIGIVLRLTDAKIELRLARRNLISPVPDSWLRQVSPIDEMQREYVLSVPGSFVPLETGPGPLMGGSTTTRFGVIVGSSCVPGVILSQAWDGAGTGVTTQNDTAGGGLGDYAKVYSRFSFAGGAKVTDFHWTGGYADPPTENAISSWLVQIWNDSAGVPGTLEQSQTFLTANQTFVSTVGGTRVYTYSVDILPWFLADPGVTYWVSVQPSLAFPPQWLWCTASGTGTARGVFFGTPYSIPNLLAIQITGCAG